MQVRGTFPELNSGMKKASRRPAKPKAPAEEKGVGGFGMSGRVARPIHAPKTLGGRRTVAHLKAARAGRG